jgi:hypothetical protein
MERNLACVGGVNYHGSKSCAPDIKYQVLGFSVLQVGDFPILSCLDWVNLDCGRLNLNLWVV